MIEGSEVTRVRSAIDRVVGLAVADFHAGLDQRLRTGAQIVKYANWSVLPSPRRGDGKAARDLYRTVRWLLEMNCVIEDARK